MHGHTERLRERSERHAARRRLKPEMRRAELVEAALAVLSSRDPTGVRVEDITRAAHAAKGTFYLYFSSWNDLLVAVRDRVLSTHMSQAMDRFADVGTATQWWTVLEEECGRFLDFHVELGNLHKAIFHGPAAEHPVEGEHLADDLISRLLRQGIALGACRPLDADMAAPLVFALLHVTADATVRSGKREERLEMLIALLRAWLNPSSSETGS